MKKILMVLAILLAAPLHSHGADADLLDRYEIPTYSYHSLFLDSRDLFDYEQTKETATGRETKKLHANLYLEEHVVKQKPGRTSRFMGGILAAPTDGANRFDDNSYDAMFTPRAVAAFEAGFALMPFLNILAGVQIQGFGFGHPRATMGPNEYRFKTDDWNVSLFYLGARFKLPVALWGSRLFAVSKAEAGMGFVPYAKMILGVSKMDGALMNYDPINFPSGDATQMFMSTMNIAVGFGIGAEVRSRVFGAFLEMNMNMLGSPDVSTLYSSMGVSSGTLLTITLSLGISFYI